MPPSGDLRHIDMRIEQMNGQEPQQTSVLLNIIPALYAALWAGVLGGINYLYKMNKGQIPIRIASFLLEMATSSAAGMVAFLVCDTAGWGWPSTVVIVSVVGHMGGRSWGLLERLIEAKVRKEIGNENFSGETGREAEESGDA